MSRSNKLKQRIALGKGKPLSAEEYENKIVLADLVERVPQGQRTEAETALLNDVRAAGAANPKDGGGG